MKVKESDDDRTRLNRVITTLQDQLEKYKKLSNDTKSKLDTTEVELTSLRKEYEQSKRQTKKQQQDQTQTDTKLNRALEEAERYKQQLSKTQQTTKDLSEQDKKKIEQLTSENRRLEKQRLELMNAFKRQLKLIDILKKQKVTSNSLHLILTKFLFSLASSRSIKNASICRRRILQSNRMEHHIIISNCIFSFICFLCKQLNIKYIFLCKSIFQSNNNIDKTFCADRHGKRQSQLCYIVHI